MGIMLYVVDYVFLFDLWWNFVVEVQVVDCVYCIGQKSMVFVYCMIMVGMIEECIQVLKVFKKDLFDKFIGGLGGDFDLSQYFSLLCDFVQLMMV